MSALYTCPVCNREVYASSGEQVPGLRVWTHLGCTEKLVRSLVEALEAIEPHYRGELGDKALDMARGRFEP